EAAIGFSAGFYQGLANGLDVPAAYELGWSRMGMSRPPNKSKSREAMKPIMLLKKGSGRAQLDLPGQAGPTPNVETLPKEPPVGRTVPTGRCFICYKRERLPEIVTLVAALHDHGIPTWQDVSNLDYFHTEQRIADVLNDPATASEVLWIS